MFWQIRRLQTTQLKVPFFQITFQKECNSYNVIFTALEASDFPISKVTPKQPAPVKRRKSYHRILPPLRKAHQTPRVRVVRIYTETALGCKIGVDCASFELV